MGSDIDWQAADSVEELAYRYQSETLASLRPRWQALWLLRQGYTRQTVAHLVGVTSRTLRQWLAWYKLGGCPEVAKHQLGTGNGQTCRLTEEQLAELAAWATTGMFYSYEDVQHWIEEHWQVQYSYDGMRSLLNRIGIYPRVPRPLATDADLDVQEAWKKGGCGQHFVRKTRLAPREWAGRMSSGSV